MELLLQRLPIVYKQSYIRFVVSIFLWIVISCFQAFILAAVINGLFGLPPAINKIIFALVTVGIFAWYYNSLIKRRVWEFRFEPDQIYWRRLGHNPIRIKREDIQEVRWQGKEIIFFTTDNTFAFDINILSGTSSIKFHSVLPHWVPSQALPPEMQSAIQKINHQTAHQLSVFEGPIAISSSPRHALTEPKNSITIVVSVLVILGCLLWLLSFGFNILALLGIFAVTIALAVFVWVILSRSIEITNDGFRYRVTLITKLFKWSEIEALLLRENELIIWVNSRCSRVHRIEAPPEEMELFEKVFWAKVHSHGIPYEFIITGKRNQEPSVREKLS